jgi:hypothetical protein
METGEEVARWHLELGIGFAAGEISEISASFRATFSIAHHRC